MHSRRVESASQSLNRLGGEVEPAWASILTRAGFVIAIALTVARLLMLEVVRESTEMVPGLAAAPRGAGAACGLVLDVLSCVPALLVLLRASLDGSFKLRRSLAFAVTGAVAVWIGASVFWAADAFLAAVNAAHWIAALALLCAMAQIVRDWSHARVVAGVATGLLFCLVTHGLIYRLVDVADMRKDWEQNKTRILQEHGWAPDSFMARQFELRVLNGNIQGFNTSPNTFATLLVTLGVVAVGAAVQRIRDRDEWGWPIAILVATPLIGFNLFYTGSKTGFVTPILAVGLIALGWTFRDGLARRRRVVFWGGVGAVALVAIAIIGHGLYRGTLPSDSLAFRWKYWVGSAKLFAHHPLLGVGWSNFGPNYLAFRLPEAAEEIKDPHNIFVRFATELGLVGALLFVGWILSLAWTMTGRAGPVVPTEALPTDRDHTALARLVGLATAGILLNIRCSIDITQNPAWITIEMLRRLLFLALLVIGIVVVALRSSEHQQIDDRPAPLLLYAMLAALAVFMLHNLVDVPMSEPGVTALFGVLVGTVIGIRGTGQTASRKLAVLAAGAASALWVVAAIGAGTIVAAENQAATGDEFLRNNDPARAAQSFDTAYRTAFVRNADYAYRNARALLFARADPNVVRAAIDRAIAADPTAGVYRRTRAMLLLSLPSPDAKQVRADFDALLALNPNDVDARVDYAGVLERLGDPAAALTQYREALRYNDLLDAAEPKRLPAPKIADLRARIAALSGNS